MKPFTLFFFALTLFTGHALAGSRFWQPQISPPDRLQSRYFHIDPKTVGTANDRVPWPNKQIRYCYADAASEAKLKANLKAAHQMWVTKGLGKDFTFVKAGEAACKDDRNNVLMIQYTGPTGGMATFVGFPSPDASLRNIDGVGPTMYLTDKAIGMLDVVSNYAHELGHAWGLYHEHQNPAFWGGDIQSADSGTVFGPANSGNWRCENLVDYNARVVGLVVQTGNGGSFGLDRNQLCRNWAAARQAQFSASDYLPMPKTFGIAHSAGHDKDDVDWNSIMIYPSGAGGIEDPSIAGSDKRLPILLQPGGDRIPINLYPSQLDIKALHSLYGNEEPVKHGLLQKVGGKTSSTFKSLFSSSKGGSGSGCL